MTLTDIHTLIRWEHVDSVQRLAETLAAADVGKVSHQIDDDTYYVLVDLGPTWTQINGGGGVGSGDVVGPSSSTDNSVARFHGTTGKIIQSHLLATLEDDSQITLAGTDAGLQLTEKAAEAGGGTGTGVLGVKSDTPSTLQFTDDTGADVKLGGATFIDLPDTPASYSGNALLIPSVNSGETAIEFVSQKIWHCVGASCTPSDTTQWRGPLGVSYHYDVDWTADYGSGADPVPQALSNFPVVFQDATMTNVEMWYRSSTTSLAGVCSIYKFTQTDGASTFPSSQLGSTLTLAASAAGAGVNDISTVFSSNNTVSKGDKICMFFRASAGVTATWQWSMSYCLELT